MIKEYKIKRYKDSVVGISLGKGTQWSLMRNNPVDYVLDGYQFINSDFIQEEHIIQDDIMLCKILPLKQKEEKLPFASPELLDSNQACWIVIKRYFLSLQKMIFSFLLVCIEVM